MFVVFDDFEAHQRKALPARQLPKGRTKRELAPVTHQLLDDMLPEGWRYQTKGARRSWRAVAWATDGRFVEARGSTWQHALAELTRRVADPRQFLQQAPRRSEGYEEPPTTEAVPRAKHWSWSHDADNFLEELCFGVVDIEKQRRFLARFKSLHSRDYDAMPPGLRKELADRRVLPGSYWPVERDSIR